MRQGIGVPGRVPGLVLAGAVALAFLLPSARIEDGPVLCPFRLLTGLPCPACGLTRSWVHLAHGQVGESFAAHPLGPATMLLAVVAAGWVIGTRGRVRPPDWLRRSALAVVLLTAAAGALRLLLELA